MRDVLMFLLGAALASLGTYSYLKKPRRRQKRHEKFLAETSGTTVGISHELILTVRLLLRHALNERRGGVWRSKQNHATVLAPAIVVIIATALDAWLSELIAFGRISMPLQSDDIARVVDIGTVAE